MTPLEGLPPGFLKEEEDAPPIELPVETPPEPPVEAEPVEQSPYVPSKPYGAVGLTSDANTKVQISWKFDDSIENIEFVVYLNSQEKIRVSGDKSVILDDVPTGETYSVTIVAIYKPTSAKSEVSDPSTFEMKLPVGFNDPNYWLPVKIDNMSVTYRK